MRGTIPRKHVERQPAVTGCKVATSSSSISSTGRNDWTKSKNTQRSVNMRLMMAGLHEQIQYLSFFFHPLAFKGNMHACRHTLCSVIGFSAHCEDLAQSISIYL